MSSIVDIFSVPISISHYTVNDNSLIEKCLSFQETTNYCYNGYTTFGTNENVLNWDEDLKNFINIKITELSTEVGIDANELKLHNSWMSINRLHAYHETHHHLPAIWSGVYYVKASDCDAKITFINPSLETNWPFIKTRTTEYTSPSWTVTPKTGTLILFPSYLKHKVEQQEIDQERITIAFNFGD
jgi:uncharacterized protein (TIGR02466 family)